MPDTPFYPGIMSKAAIIEWLEARAAAYGKDAEELDRYLADPSNHAEELHALPAVYREIRSALITEARNFTDHGPLPALPEVTRRKTLSHAARCPLWPDGCGELARYERGDKGSAVVYHRPGCAVDAAIRAEADAAAQVGGHDLRRVYVGTDGATWHCSCRKSGGVTRADADEDLTRKAESAHLRHACRQPSTGPAA